MYSLSSSFYLRNLNGQDCCWRFFWRLSNRFGENLGRETNHAAVFTSFTWFVWLFTSLFFFWKGEKSFVRLNEMEIVFNLWSVGFFGPTKSRLVEEGRKWMTRFLLRQIRDLLYRSITLKGQRERRKSRPLTLCVNIYIYIYSLRNVIRWITSLSLSGHGEKTILPPLY